MLSSVGEMHVPHNEGTRLHSSDSTSRILRFCPNLLQTACFVAVILCRLTVASRQMVQPIPTWNKKQTDGQQFDEISRFFRIPLPRLLLDQLLGMGLGGGFVAEGFRFGLPVRA